MTEQKVAAFEQAPAGRNAPLIIGVAGGSGSGKTTVSRHIVERVGPEQVALLQHDSYYKDQSHLSRQERALLNVDHPDALDNELLIRHLELLREGHAVEVPVYDYTTYTRSPHAIRVEPRPVIIVEGILIFADPHLRQMMGLKIYVDTDADLRFIRRLRRDITERGRSVESVVEHYLDTVRLMHLEFVEPSKRYADLIIPAGGYEIPALLNKIYRVVRLMENG